MTSLDVSRDDGRGMSDPVSATVDQLARELEVQPDRGLSAEEARARLSTYGENKLAAGKKESPLKAFLRQYQDFMQIVLLVAAVVNLFATQDIGTSLVLAKAIEKIKADAGADLVLCGMASTDASGSVVPAMLAERLGLPQVTLASVVESQGDQVRIKRDNEGSTEVIGATLPIVLSVTDQSGEARYPSFKGIMAAKKKPLETWSLADLGVDAGEVGLSVAWSQVEDTTERPPRTAGEIVTDEDGSGAGALVDFLASKKFI